MKSRWSDFIEWLIDWLIIGFGILVAIAMLIRLIGRLL